MNTELTARQERRAQAVAARRAQRNRTGGPDARIRVLAFAAVVIAVLAIGAFLAFGDFFGRPTAAVGTIDVQSSMAGFTPSAITVKGGTTAQISWWTNDAAIHLQGGVHTMIAPELGLHEELAAESRRTFSWDVPNTPGTFDVYCDSCCGGKGSPQMHGKIVILPAGAS